MKKDCNNSKVFFEECDRMCSMYRHANYCESKCVFHHYINDNNNCKENLFLNKPDYFIDLIQKWSDENQIMTLLDKIKEIFPNIELVEDGLPFCKPCNLLGYDLDCAFNCDETVCWLQEYKERD